MTYQVPAWACFKIAPLAKYLGVFLGPRAGQKQWHAQHNKWVDRARAIANMGTAASISVFQYNTRAVSTLSYIMQFCFPPAWLLRKERWCLAKILHIPYKAYPDTAYFAFRQWGGIDCVSVKALSFACLLRMATKTAPGWQQHFLALKAVAEEHLPALRVCQEKLYPPFWDTEAFVCVLFQTVKSASSIPFTLSRARVRESARERRRDLEPLVPHPFSIPSRELMPVQQADAYISFLKLQVPDDFWIRFISRRLGPLLGCDLRLQGYLFGALFRTLKRAPLHIAMCFLKTVANAWPTSHRLHLEVRSKCLFGCAAADSLCHYLKCIDLHWAISVVLKDPLLCNYPTPMNYFPPLVGQTGMS